MARNGNAPKALERTTDRGVPLVGLILAFVIGLIAFLPFPSWQQLVGFITSATVLSFASGPLVHRRAARRSSPTRSGRSGCPAATPSRCSPSGAPT